MRSHAISGLLVAAALLLAACQPITTPIEAFATGGGARVPAAPVCDVCDVVEIDQRVVLRYQPVSSYGYDYRQTFYAAADPGTLFSDVVMRGTVSVERAADNLIVRDRFRVVSSHYDGTRDDTGDVVYRLLMTPTGTILDAAMTEDGQISPLDDDSIEGVRRSYEDYYPKYDSRGYRTGDTFPTNHIYPLQTTLDGRGFSRRGRSVVLGTGFDGAGLVVASQGEFSSTTGSGTTEGYLVVDIDSGMLVAFEFLTLETATDEPGVIYVTETSLLPE